MPTNPLPLAFVTSADDHDTLPATELEIAVWGRSNVGKSSLVNAVAGRKGLAHTSSTPGRTQLLNLFEVAPGRTVVDLPGYGWARASKTDRAHWQERTERYLEWRDGLEAVLLLVDGEVGPTDLDRRMMGGLRRGGHDVVIVATKHDKVKSSARTKRRRELAAGCEIGEGDVVWTSATTGVNIDRLRDVIRGWLEL